MIITLKDLIEKPYLRHLVLFKLVAFHRLEYRELDMLSQLAKVYSIIDSKNPYEKVHDIYRYLAWAADQYIYFNHSHKEPPLKLFNETIKVFTSLAKANDIAKLKSLSKDGEDFFTQCYVNDRVLDVHDFWFAMFSMLRDVGMKDELIKVLREEVFDPQNFELINLLKNLYESSPHLTKDQSNRYEDWKPITLEKAINLDMTKLQYFTGPNWHIIPNELKDEFDSLVLAKEMILQ